MNDRVGEVAINLIPLRDGVPIDDFKRFSSEVDQPLCLAQDVVLGFSAYAVTGRGPGAPSVDIVEVMSLTSWDDWVDVRDNLEAMAEVTSGFERLVDPTTVRTLFATPIERRG
jgi:hypothetical protein